MNLCWYCKKEYIVGPGSKGKFCSLSCGNYFRAPFDRLKRLEQRLLAVKLYQEYPKQCQECFFVLSFSKRCCKFCSRSCAAKRNNREFPKTGPHKKRIQVRIKVIRHFRRCDFCQKWFEHKKYILKKYCSDGCSKQAQSIRMTIRNNRSPIKQSWMESSFEQWLVGKGLKNSLHGFLCEVNFYNPVSKKYGRADFVFPKQRVIIELDGTHHDQPGRKALDLIRDTYLATRGWQVVRIRHTDYKKKSRIVEIERLIRSNLLVV